MGDMSRDRMHRIGLIVAIVLGVAGLVAVGVFIFMAIALQSWGSNK